jgi:hypothetical protein
MEPILWSFQALKRPKTSTKEKRSPGAFGTIFSTTVGKGQIMLRSTTFSGLTTAMLALTMTLFVSACKNAEKHLLQGNYEAALDEALDILERGGKKKRDETILVLEDAFALAWERDQEQLRILDAQGFEVGWFDKLSIYEGLKYRQDKLRPFLPLFIKSENRYAEIEFVDVTSEIAEARLQVTEYLYREANGLLATGNRFDARDAHGMLEKLESISGPYRDSRQLRQHARELGTSQVVVQVQPQGVPALPHSVLTNLRTADLRSLEDFWTNYENGSTVPGTGPADYRIRVRLQFAQTSAPRTQEMHFRETADVEDGVKYVKGVNKGDIDTVIAYRTIYADVVRTTQFKSATLSGEIQYLDDYGKLMETFPISAVIEFSNAFTRATGNLDALTDKSRSELKGGMLPYPNDLAMMYDVGLQFERIMLDAFAAHQDLIE